MKTRRGQHPGRKYLEEENVICYVQHSDRSCKEHELLSTLHHMQVFDELGKCSFCEIVKAKLYSQWFQKGIIVLLRNLATIGSRSTRQIME